MRRVPESTATLFPEDEFRVIGPTVASKETTRSAGASPMLTCMRLALAGDTAGGIVLEPPPPQPILAASSIASAASVRYRHCVQKPFASFTGNCISFPFRSPEMLLR